ncbi:protein neuralized-like isoform X1 [Portunus trituberculatus]|uniref:Protein neuralized n=1 Tax=Portunus trituberculatus TaxID=210409 RepID=A0A5B7FL11_PORTR|nr:protein neuralized-like isoform X1 [Portunus trituberculatus]MPC48121.1 Protein neuralized [Portunus trituberculatus]
MPALCIEEYAAEPTVTCYTAGPIFKKMKVLKKFKRRMGLAGRQSGTSNLPPLTFHPVCGENVRIANDGRVARRTESFCKGIAFSNRPIRIGERVCLRLLEVNSNWSGVIRFGFTSQDPAGLRDALPKYACPDLTNKPGYWAKALSERFAEQGSILFYYADSSGDVHFGINGEERGVFFSGVDTRSQLWGLFDVYGNSTAVEFLDPESQLNNRVRIVNDLSPGSSTASSRVVPQAALPAPQSQTQPPARPDSGVERLQPSMAQLALTPTPRSPDALPLRHYAHTAFTPLPFHRVRGRNVRLNNDRTVAARTETEYSHGYVFTARPLRPGERLVVQVLHVEAMYVGALAFGLTSANPAGLEPSELPEDCDLLLDRLEYWVVSKDVAASPQPADELAFALSHQGEVTFSRNGAAPQVFMHVDHTLQLWAFFDVYGNTSKIRSLGVTHDPAPPQQPASSSPPRRPEPVGRPAHPQLSRASPLVVSLPPSPPSPPTTHTHNASPPPPLPAPREPISGHGTMSSVYSGAYMEPVSASSTLTSRGDLPPGPALHECTVCYEKPVDSVLYMCGHMCMCYECALQQWRGRGGGQCPICRAVIRDVIRTYRS